MNENPYKSPPLTDPQLPADSTSTSRMRAAIQTTVGVLLGLVLGAVVGAVVLMAIFFFAKP
jgi:uncharacterized membrane protein YgaE (UPF0421/DUF939 family)